MGWDPMTHLDLPEHLRRLKLQKLQKKHNAAREESFLKAAVYMFDVTTQASAVDKLISRDLNYLMTAVQDPSVPIERRAKILEVMILRGANNKFSYDEMSQPMLVGLQKEAREYQAATWHAVFNGDPQLFQQISRSTDQLPSGRYPATEFMNTMLREGGLVGSYDARQRFEQWMVTLPPQLEGQAMYHLLDAGEAKDNNSSARVNSIDVGIGGVGWEGAKDTHWETVIKDVSGEVKKSLKDEERIEGFRQGYQEAAGVRSLPIGK
jgi:hypothetical protein